MHIRPRDNRFFRMEFVKLHNTSRTIFRFIRLSLSVQWSDISKSRMVHSDWNLTKLSIFNQNLKPGRQIFLSYLSWLSRMILKNWPRKTKPGRDWPIWTQIDQYGQLLINLDPKDQKGPCWPIWTQKDHADQFGPIRTVRTNLDPKGSKPTVTDLFGP